MATILIAFIYIVKNVVGPRPFDGHGVFVGVGWGMCSRSCELAHEVDATL